MCTWTVFNEPVICIPVLSAMYTCTQWTRQMYNSTVFNVYPYCLQWRCKAIMSIKCIPVLSLIFTCTVFNEPVKCITVLSSMYTCTVVIEPVKCITELSSIYTRTVFNVCLYCFQWTCQMYTRTVFNEDVKRSCPSNVYPYWFQRCKLLHAAAKAHQSSLTSPSLWD